jgi:hypothetical protein
LSEREHGIAYVNPDDVAGQPDDLGHLGGQQTRPGANIEHPLPWPQR